MVIKTLEDGWDCVPELQGVISELEMIDSFTYEIKNCVRTSDLRELVDQMTEYLQNSIHLLQDIDTSKEYETIKD
jgi:hypothetical protein